MKTKLKILNVWIEHKVDESPNTSYLGEYSSETPSSGYYLDRKTGELKRGSDDSVVATDLPAKHERNTYQYISGFQHGEGMRGWEHVDDKGVANGFLHARYRLNGKGRKLGNLFAQYGVIGWEKAVTREDKIRCLNIVYCCEDASRLEAINDGDISYMGVIAKAEIQVSDVVQTIRSGGLWGVESDSDAAYLKEVESDELSSLKSELSALGLGERAIAHAFKQVETVNQ